MHSFILFLLINAATNIFICVASYWEMRPHSFRKVYFIFLLITSKEPFGVLIGLKKLFGTFLVAQWLRIRLPTQGTRVWALVWGDPTCRGATKPVCHNYWACTLELVSHDYWAHEPQLLKPAHLEPVLCNKRSHCKEKPMPHNEE